MRHGWCAPTALALVIGVGLLMPGPLAGQTPAAGKKASAVRRTADGRPDLQDVWDYRSVTPLERPSELAGKQVFSDEEAAEFEGIAIVRRAVAKMTSPDHAAVSAGRGGSLANLS